MVKNKKWKSNIKKTVDISNIELTNNFKKNLLLMVPGQMTHTLINVNGQSEFCFLIMEEKSYLKNITYNPMFQQELVGTIVNGTFAVVHMVKVNNEESTLYETWLNYHNKVDGYCDIETLASQNSIKIVIVNPYGEVIKAYEETNIFKNEYNALQKEIKNMCSWSMEEYNQAKMILSNEYPSVSELWTCMEIKIRTNRIGYNKENLQEIVIGFDDEDASDVKNTMKQIEQAKGFKLELVDDEGNKLTWDKIDDYNNDKTIFQAILADRKQRIDNNVLMADRPNFAVLTIEEDKIVRLEYYAGHDCLELVFDIRAKEYIDKIMEKNMPIDWVSYEQGMIPPLKMKKVRKGRSNYINRSNYLVEPTITLEKHREELAETIFGEIEKIFNNFNK